MPHCRVLFKSLYCHPWWPYLGIHHQIFLFSYYFGCVTTIKLFYFLVTLSSKFCLLVCYKLSILLLKIAKAKAGCVIIICWKWLWNKSWLMHSIGLQNRLKKLHSNTQNSNAKCTGKQSMNWRVTSKAGKFSTIEKLKLKKKKL